MRIRRLIGFSMIFILLLLSGCSKTKKTNVESEEQKFDSSVLQVDNREQGKKPVGRYVAQNIDLEIEDENCYLKVAIDASGEIELFTYDFDFNDEKDMSHVYHRTNVNGEKVTGKLEGFEKAEEEDRMTPFEITYGNDNSYYMLAQGNFPETMEEDNKSHYVLTQQEIGSNEYQNLTPESWMPGNEFQYSMIEQIQISKSGILCYKTYKNSTFYFYDLKKREDVYFDSLETRHAYTVKGDLLYYIPTSNDSINCYNLVTKEETEFPGTFGDKVYGIDIDENHDIYILDTEGIHVLKNNGTLWETLVDNTICNMKETAESVLEFYCIPGEYATFYVGYYDKVSYDAELKKFTYSENAELLQQKELSIYSLWENKTIEAAVSEYKKVHPEVSINFEVLSEEGNDALLNDMIHGINTELLSGKGADIIVLDGLPMKDYIEKGVLLDISQIFNEKIEDGTFRKNIAECYVYDGKVYGMPLRFAVPVYSYFEPTKVPNLATIVEKTRYTKGYLESFSYEILLSRFLYTYYDELIAADGVIKKDEFKDFLMNIKLLGEQTDTGEETSSQRKIESNQGSLYQQMQTVLSSDCFPLLTSNTGLTMNYLNNLINLFLNVGCISEVNGTMTSINQTFVPSGVIGINQASQDKELAKDFVQFLYEEELQSHDFQDGFPMNQKALEQWITYQEIEEHDILTLLDSEGKEHTFNMDESIFTEDMVTKLNELFDSLTKSVNDNTTTHSILYEGGMAYLNGEKSLDEVADDIEQKINLYLSE